MELLHVGSSRTFANRTVRSKYDWSSGRLVNGRLIGQADGWSTDDWSSELFVLRTADQGFLENKEMYSNISHTNINT